MAITFIILREHVSVLLQIIVHMHTVDPLFCWNLSWSVCWSQSLVNIKHFQLSVVGSHT